MCEHDFLLLNRLVLFQFCVASFFPTVWLGIWEFSIEFFPQKIHTDNEKEKAQK